MTPMPTNKRSDVTIAVMGPTGTGKSAFIKLVTGDQNITVGHGVHSETTEITLSNYFEEDGRCITFVDTPGFDDSRRGVSDAVILQKIAAFLETEHQEGKKLHGIIYLHRITDPRMGGISSTNLRMFQSLCGTESLRNVVIVTTRWDEVQEDRVVERERELMNGPGFFQPLISAGAQAFRHNNTLESSRRILKRLLENVPVALEIQKELAAGTQLQNTAAAFELDMHIKSLIERHEAELQEMKRAMDNALVEKDHQFHEALKKERENLKSELQKWNNEKRILQEDLDGVRAEALIKQAAATRDLEEQRLLILDELEQERKARIGLASELQEERRNRERHEAESGKERQAFERRMEAMEKRLRLSTEGTSYIVKSVAEKQETDLRWQQLLDKERTRAKEDMVKAERRIEELLSRIPAAQKRKFSLHRFLRGGQ